MLLQDLKDLFPSETLEIVVDNARQFSSGTIVRIRSIGDSTTAYIEPENSPVSNKIALRNIEGNFKTKHFSELWNQIQNTRYIAQVSPLSENELMIFVIYGIFEKDLLGDFEIAVTDKQIKNKSDKPLRSVQAVKTHILNDYVLRVRNDQYIVVAKHPFGNSSTFMISDGKNTYSVIECSRRELGVLESSFSTDIPEESQNKKEPSDMIWTINSCERPFNNPSDFTVELWKCQLKLADETTAEKQRIATKAFIDSGLDKYLEAWKQYTEKEFELIQNIQSRAGILRYRDATFISGQRYKVTIDNPQVLTDFLSCLDGLGNDSSIDIDASYYDKKGRKREGKKIAHFFPDSDKNTAVIEMLDGIPVSAGTIEISIAMAKAQYDRRINALQRILSQNSAKKDLAMLIGGEKAVVSGLLPTSSEKAAPLSELVLKCFNGHMPTDTQRRAISIALGTPDFAIIQGPPGTGKTTVINGIMQALTEKEKDPQLSYGKNLLTAYQRDATTHLAEKLRIYGLPTPVYMGVRGNHASHVGDLETKDYSMESWILEKRKELQKINPDIANLEASDQLADRLHLLKSHFAPENATLGQIQSILETMIAAIEVCEKTESEIYKQRVLSIRSQSVDDLLKEGSAVSLKAPMRFNAQLETGRLLLEEVNHKIDETQHQLDRYHAGHLATTDAAMSDNGHEISIRILKRFLNKHYSNEVIQVVQSLMKLYEETPVPYNKIQNRKDILLYLLNQSNWNSVDRELNRKVSDLIDGLLEYVEKSNGTDEQRVLADYHNAFDVDNDNVLREWLSDFMTAIAATHQRVVSNPVKSHKGIEKLPGQLEPAVEFSNVLIDEAARSCPPDLLIPLSCALDRMILVGDQNQLPQFISDEVYEKIDGFSKSELDSLVRKTMFERLIEQVKKLEARDHIPRFVKLREQYRMPKTLGDIISKYFYQGELDSPLGNDNNHTPDLAYIQGKHLVWLDVSGGSQSLTNEHSLVRQSEVTAIVRMLKSMIKKSSNAQNYTFAIITFYSAQRDRLIRAIKEDNYLSNWQQTHQNRITIGTVDAFQGMEADIVFLSLVRSLPKYDKGRNLYGFLANSNRQCVALSRAKRCLIITGDKAMVTGTRAKAAKEVMPAIERIYQLCRKEEITDACVLKDREITDM